MTLQNLLRIGKQRNANDYTGQPITTAVVSECVSQAKALRKALRTRLDAEHPHLLKTAKGE